MTQSYKMRTQYKLSWQWLKLVLAFVNFSLSFSIEFTKLQRHSITSVRLAGHYKSIDTSNTRLISCSLHCHGDQDCVSINYNMGTETCEMNDKSSEYGVVDLMTEQNWNVYSIVQSRCSKGWLNFLGSCYWFEKERKENWTTALSNCTALNAQLLQIESKSEKLFIKAELQLLISNPYKDAKRVWIAGNDIDEENKWVWAGMNGEVMALAAGGVIELTDWDKDQPNNWKEQDCLTISLKNKYQWNDGACSDQYYYICEV